MPQYRVEVSPNNRAGCTEKWCKDNNVKIFKGELRFGTWLELANVGHGSWRWKHWGCVSGLQIQHLRELIESDGSYDFDGIDGYDELGDHPDLQAKIRRVVKQGHIDEEDFNGDPEYNKLGSRGIRGRVVKAKDAEDEESNPATPAKKTSTAKRGRKADAIEEDEEDAPKPPKKKAKGSEAAKRGGSGADAAEETPKGSSAKAKQGATKKAAKAGGKVESQPEAAPKRSSASAKKDGKAPKGKGNGNVAEEDTPVPKAPAKGKRGAAGKAVKTKDEEEVESKPADVEAAEGHVPKAKPARKSRGGSDSTKKAPVAKKRGKKPAA